MYRVRLGAGNDRTEEQRPAATRQFMGDCPGAQNIGKDKSCGYLRLGALFKQNRTWEACIIGLKRKAVGLEELLVYGGRVARELEGRDYKLSPDRCVFGCHGRRGYSFGAQLTPKVGFHTVWHKREGKGLPLRGPS